MDVARPNGKVVALTTSIYITPSDFYVKNRCYKIDGKIINTWRRAADGDYQTGEVNAANSNAAHTGDYLTITQVFGTRKMSLV